MLRTGKQAALQATERLGAFSAVRASGWRRDRLLILCYHGISLEDEHEWDPQLYMPQALFRRRMEALRKSGCEVLPLGEALDRLACGALQRPSVAITFDDGVHDFYVRALPVIREYGFPVTVYLTTYYCANNLPVFNGICSYLLWKARGRRLAARSLTGEQKHYDLTTGGGIAAAAADLREFALSRRFAAGEKHQLAARLAAETGADFEAILSKRILRIMTPAEVKEAAAAGVDIQLHTHRHRAPLDRDLFRREVEENRAFIEGLTGAPARDFCYPSGVFHARFFPWLRELNVRSATTCERGLASRRTDPLLLPRLVDASTVTDVEFKGWLSGAASLLPRRRGDSANEGS